MEYFGLTPGQTLAMFFTGYVLISAVIFFIGLFCRLLSWSFHKLLARLAAPPDDTDS